MNHNIQIGNVKLIDETTGRISNILASITDATQASNISNLQIQVSNLAKQVGNIEHLPDLYLIYEKFSNIDTNQEQIGILQGNVSSLELVIGGTTDESGLVKDVSTLQGNVSANQQQINFLQSNISDIRGNGNNTSVNLESLHAMIIDLQTVSKDSFKIQVTSVTQDSVNMNLNGGASTYNEETLTVTLEKLEELGNIDKSVTINGYAGNTDLLFNNLTGNTVYIVKVAFTKSLLIYQIQVSTA